MTVRYMKGDFEFPPGFGFSGSAQGGHGPRAHPVKSNDEYGRQNLAGGGQPQPQRPPMPRQGHQAQAPMGTPMVPAPMAMNAAKGALALGAMQGARAARRGGMPGAPAGGAPPPTAGRLPGAGMPPGGGPPMPSAPMGQAPGMPAMKDGGHFIQDAVKRPGRMKRAAARNGVSLGAEIAKDKHSDDPSLRAAANLGARFRGGDLKKGK